MNETRGYRDTIETWHAAAVQHIDELGKAFAQFRRDLRDLLDKKDVRSNPGWSERDIVQAFEELLFRRSGITPDRYEPDAVYCSDCCGAAPAPAHLPESIGMNPKVRLCPKHAWTDQLIRLLRWYHGMFMPDDHIANHRGGDCEHCNARNLLRSLGEEA